MKLQYLVDMYFYKNKVVSFYMYLSLYTSSFNTFCQEETRFLCHFLFRPKLIYILYYYYFINEIFNRFLVLLMK